MIGINNLVARNLCVSHNSALSRLDDEAARFVAAVSESNRRASSDEMQYLFSGHDLERWMLKVLVGLGVSGNLASKGMPSRSNLDPRVKLIELLEAPETWVHPMGLYFTQALGDRYQHRDEISFAALRSSDTAALAGLLMDIHGLTFALLTYPFPSLAGSGLDQRCYRPSTLQFRGGRNHTIRISWLDPNFRAEIGIQAEEP